MPRIRKRVSPIILSIMGRAMRKYTAGYGSSTIDRTEALSNEIVKHLYDMGYAIVPIKLNEDQIDRALSATASWKNLKGSRKTVNRIKQQIRHQALIKSIYEK